MILTGTKNELFNLNNKICVVTGGAGILGEKFSYTLSKFGATVIIVDKNANQCKNLASKISKETGNFVIGKKVDLSSEKSIEKFSSYLKETFGNVDVLVNNAAKKPSGFFKNLDNYDLKTWNEVLSINLNSIFLMCKHLEPLLIKNKSASIINISSIYGFLGPDQSIYKGSWYEDLGGEINTPLIYSATKGAVISMTKYLATYWGDKGIRVNTISPGGVKSGQNTTFENKYKKKVPLKRMANKSDLVGALIFLASDSSSYVTGQNMIIDGGLSTW